MPSGSRERRPRRSERWEGWLSEVGQLVRDGETTEKEGWGREDENSNIGVRENLEEQNRDEFSRRRRRFEHRWHPTVWFSTRRKLRENFSSVEGGSNESGSNEGGSKTMRELVEELQQLNQEEEARQLEQLEALKQRHAKELDPKEREKDDNAGGEDGENYVGVEDGEKEDNTISLSQAQEMNTVYMEGDNSTQGFHFRL